MNWSPRNHMTVPQANQPLGRPKHRAPFPLFVRKAYFLLQVKLQFLAIPTPRADLTATPARTGLLSVLAKL